MSAFSICVRIGLAIVLGGAAILKLRRVENFRRTLAELGLSRPYVALLAVAVPAAELLTATGLLSPYAFEAAFATVVLLAAFLAVVAHALSRGRAVECNCFGGAFDIDSWKSALLGLAMAVAALVVLAEGPGPSSSWAHGAAANYHMAEVAQIVVVLMAGLTVYASWRSVWRQGRTSDGSSTGATSVPENADIVPLGDAFLTDPVNGIRVSLSSLIPESRMLALVFVSPNCAWCSVAISEVETWAAVVQERIEVVFVGSGTLQAAEMKFAAAKLRVLLQQDKVVEEGLGVLGVPSMLFLLPDESVAGPVCGGIGPMRQAMSRLAASIAAPPRA